jgi:hypothetical protein
VRPRLILAAVTPVWLALAGCGSRPTELVPPLGKAELVDASAEHPRLKFTDGSVSVNDTCPVTKRKLNVAFPPVYVNGQPIGFC